MYDYIDINECSMNNGGCSQLCINANGNYSCSCYSGYELKNSYNCFGKLPTQ